MKHFVMSLLSVMLLLATLLLAGCEVVTCQSVAQLTVEMTETWIEQGCDDVSCPGEDCEEAIICVLCEEWGAPDAEHIDGNVVLKLPN